MTEVDTDSLFINIEEFILNNIEDSSKWLTLSDEIKIEYVLKISKVIENYVNDRIFNETQLIDYASQVNDFRIMFKQEIIAKSALFCKKKKYACWIVNEEGTPTDELAVKGLEIVRSDSAEAIRSRLSHIYELIMKQAPDSDIQKLIQKYKAELKSVSPEDIAANIGINNINKYLSTGKPLKGTPWHVKGVHNYRILLKMFNLEGKYENIGEGGKAKVVYIKSNPFNIDTLTFKKWPIEFDRYLDIDNELMIDKFFIKKIGFLLNPMNKIHLMQPDKSALFALFS